MSFCTAINCMDGRVQLPVFEFLTDFFDVEYVDTVTEPGVNRILAEATNQPLLDSIETRVRISVEKHGSVGIAIVGHYDCAGNPTPEEAQTDHTRAAVQYIKKMFPNLSVIGLWVDQDWRVTRITD